jgi:hypothetical protein
MGSTPQRAGVSSRVVPTKKREFGGERCAGNSSGSIRRGFVPTYGNPASGPATPVLMGKNSHGILPLRDSLRQEPNKNMWGTGVRSDHASYHRKENEHREAFGADAGAAAARLSCGEPICPVIPWNCWAGGSWSSCCSPGCRCWCCRCGQERPWVEPPTSLFC